MRTFVPTISSLAIALACLPATVFAGEADVLWRNGQTGQNVIWKSANGGTPLAVPGVTNLAWRPLM